MSIREPSATCRPRSNVNLPARLALTALFVLSVSSTQALSSSASQADLPKSVHPLEEVRTANSRGAGELLAIPDLPTSPPRCPPASPGNPPADGLGRSLDDHDAHFFVKLTENNLPDAISHCHGASVSRRESRPNRGENP
mgnify:CR=1 FL=1